RARQPGQRESFSDLIEGAACTCARRRRQGPAAVDARDLQRRGAARYARRDQEPQRLQCRGACTLCRRDAAWTDELRPAWKSKTPARYRERAFFIMRERSVVAAHQRVAVVGALVAPVVTIGIVVPAIVMAKTIAGIAGNRSFLVGRIRGEGAGA